MVCDTVRLVPSHPGIAVPDEATFHATIAKARSAGFGPEVQRRILLGTYAVTTEAWDSYYMAAVSLRCALMDQLAEHWRETDLRIGTAGHAQGVDVLVHPTALRGAPKLAEDAAFECAQDALTTYANLAGVPVLSAPATQTIQDDDGVALPVGISFATQWGHDDLVLDVVEQLAMHTDLLAKDARLQ